MGASRKVASAPAQGVDERVGQARVIDSFAKLTPREQAKNPVMLMVYISAILTLGLFALSLFGIADAHPGFIFAVSAVLWLTVLFANFAERSPRDAASSSRLVARREARHRRP